MIHKEVIRNKVKAINKSAPSIESIMDGLRVSKEDAESIQIMFVLTLKGNCQGSIDLLEEFIYTLTEKSKINFQVFNMTFLKRLEVENNCKYFGMLVANYICENQLTKEIMVKSRYARENEEFYIAPNFEKFLDLMPILIHYESFGYLGKPYTEKIKIQTVDLIKDLLSSIKYYEFFEASILG